MRLSLIALAALALAAAPASAQSTPAPVIDLSPVRKDLRNLVVAQEVYFTDHNRYSPDLGVLSLQPSDSVTIKFVEVSANSWAASGSIKGKASASCVVMVGRVAALPKTAQGNAARAEGGVLCDGDAPGK
ncbi:MAG: hypothetical protein ABIR92_01325 [Gemmatimonadaceae bacterium]